MKRKEEVCVTKCVKTKPPLKDKRKDRLRPHEAVHAVKAVYNMKTAESLLFIQETTEHLVERESNANVLSCSLRSHLFSFNSWNSPFSCPPLLNMFLSQSPYFMIMIILLISHYVILFKKPSVTHGNVLFCLEAANDSNYFCQNSCREFFRHSTYSSRFLGIVYWDI